MIKKYNLALTPLDLNNRDTTVNLSKKIEAIADKYKLGEKSHPHITLYQFELEEKQINTAWESIRDNWQEPPIFLEFKEFSCLTFDNKINWVSLLPNKADLLQKMHAKIAAGLNLPIKKSFDPHMTLISTKNNDYKKEVEKISKAYTPISGAFALTLGLSDDIGQLTDFIYRCRLRNY